MFCFISKPTWGLECSKESATLCKKIYIYIFKLDTTGARDNSNFEWKDFLPFLDM